MDSSKLKIKDSRIAKWIFYAMAFIFPFYIVFAAELISFDNIGAVSSLLFTSTPMLYLFDVIFVSLIYGAVTALSKRPYIGAIVTSIPILALAISNYFKMKIMDKTVLPSDVLFLGNAGDIVSFTDSLVPTLAMWIFVIITIAYIVFLALLNRKHKLGIKKRLILRLLTPVCCFFMLYVFTMTDAIRTSVYPIFNVDIDKAYDSEYNYRSHGIIGSFIINVGNLKIESMPYSSEIVKNAASEFEVEDEGEFEEKPDVIVILSEAFWDVNQLSNVEIEPDPLANYKKIAEEGVKINMVSMTFAGGTVRPEFEVLTGLTVEALPDGCVPYQQFVHRETDSLASYFKSYGYSAKGIHTYKTNFYNRSGAYPLMGFDSFEGKEYIPVKVKETGGKVSDETFCDWIIYELEQAGDTPLFLNALSMENHAPYEDKFDESELAVSVTAKTDISELDLNQILNLSQGIYDADVQLGRLIEYLENREKPTVVLFYGDHVSYAGEEYSNLVAGGMLSSSDSSDWSDEELLSLYTTPALIWSNYKDESYNAGYLSSYQLGALMLDYIDAPKNTLYSFLDSYREVLPAHNLLFSVTENGELRRNDSLTDEEQSYVDTHKLFTYDILIKKNYLLGNN